MRDKLKSMNKKQINSIVAILFVLAALAYGWIKPQSDLRDFESDTSQESIDALFQNRVSGKMVQFQGTVKKVLSDDNDGSRHQRFIVALASSHTVLVAHNIDLAPRVPLKTHQQIKIFGQYEWNNKGGVVHWTHTDPAGKHAAGWIEYQGRIYQ